MSSTRRGWRRVSSALFWSLVAASGCYVIPHGYDLTLSDVSATRDPLDQSVTVVGTITCSGLGGYSCAKNDPAVQIDAMFCGPAMPSGPPGCQLSYAGPEQFQEATERLDGTTWDFTMRFAAAPSGTDWPYIEVLAAGSGEAGGDSTFISTPP